jgi:very-short-patch-repair endonuclease
MDGWNNCNDLMRAQHGLITRGQAHDLGLSRHQIAGRVARGEWLRVAPTVFRSATAPGGSWDRLHAAVLASAGVASHRSAAALLGLRSHAPPRPEITVRRFGRYTGPAILHRSGDLVDRDITVIEGIAATNAIRTVLDLGAVVSALALESALHRGLHSGLIDFDQLVTRFFEVARRGRNGVGPLRPILQAHDPAMAPAESDLEVLLLRILRDGGLPPPVRQHRITVGGRRYRIDVAYPDLMIAIEGDGFGIHTERNRWESGMDRQNEIVLDEWMVLRFSWRKLCTEPGDVVRQVAQALRLRARS